jgi:hypothetical protein
MDTLSHGLWALAIFWGTNYRWRAFFIGMIPDLLSFGIYLPYRFISAGFHLGRPDGSVIPSWVGMSYNVTHSFVTWILIGALLYWLGKRYWPIVFAAIAHIALDIPTHCSFFPTPFLWPLASYTYCGVSWATPWIFRLNWLCLALIFTLIGVHEWQKWRAQRIAHSPRASKKPAKLKKRRRVQ